VGRLNRSKTYVRRVSLSTVHTPSPGPAGGRDCYNIRPAKFPRFTVIDRSRKEDAAAMNNLNRNVFFLVSITVLTVLAATLLHNLGMSYLEGEPRRLIQSLEFVIQTMTTVGYGQDAGWNHALMYLLVIAMQMAGITLVFLSIPIVVTPWLEQRMTLRPPERYSGPGDHILLSRHTSILATLTEELRDRDVPHVLLDPDESRLIAPYREGHSVMTGDPVEPEVLQRARIDEARAMVLDGPVEHIAAVALSLQDEQQDLTVTAIAGEVDRSTHLRSAGVDEVLFPREKVGEVLAGTALAGLGRTVEVKGELDEQFEIQEFPVLASSPLLRTPLRDSRIREQTGAHVIGLWRQGKLTHNPSPETRIRRNDLLVAVGTRSQLEELGELAQSRERLRGVGKGRVLLIGYGRSGRTIAKRLREEQVEPTVVDLEDDGHGEVDVIGDATDSEILEAAGVEEAATVVVSVASDDTAIFITLMVRRLNATTEILVRSNRSDSNPSLYRAGANYVQALDQVTSRMLAGTILGEDLVHEELNVRIRHCRVGDLAGKSLLEERVGEQHEVTVLAVEREGSLLTSPGPDFRLREGDRLYVAGRDENVTRFAEYYDIEEGS